MKKYFLLFAMLTLFTSCSQSAGDPAVEPATSVQPASDASNDSPVQVDAPEAAPANADGFVFLYNDKNVYMDENIADVLTTLGEPSKTYEMPSCAFDGIDKIFSYPGANIHTYPADGADFVHTINYMDDSIKTAEGIRLGQSFDEVAAAYGSEYEEDGGYYIYYKGGTYVRFLFKDDVLIAITYGLKDYMEEI